MPSGTLSSCCGRARGGSRRASKVKKKWPTSSLRRRARSAHDVNTLGWCRRITQQRGESGLVRGSRGGAQAGSGEFDGCWHRERRAQAANWSALRARQAGSRAGDAQHDAECRSNDPDATRWLLTDAFLHSTRLVDWVDWESTLRASENSLPQSTE